MPYRDQYDFCTPEGFEDEDFEYVFNFQNTPALAAPIAPGQTSLNIPLQLQSDAPYMIRAIQVANPQSVLSIRFRDAFEQFLSDDFVPSWCYASTQGDNGAVQEPELPCPAGSVILVDLKNVS
jgi:hypothetical protein